MDNHNNRTPSLTVDVAIAIDGAGQGLEPALQGLASSLVDKTRNARTFTTIAVLDTVAQIVGGPLTAGLFSIGRSEVKGSSGVCFLVSSVGAVQVLCWQLPSFLIFHSVYLRSCFC